MEDIVQNNKVETQEPSWSVSYNLQGTGLFSFSFIGL